MGDIVSRGELFPPKLANEIFNTIRGKSSLAKLSGQKPIPFNGTKEFTFAMDSEVDIVAENGAKSNGGATVTPITIVPIKIEYGARVSDEFLYAEEEEAISILQAWTEGFGRKAARALDIMAMHGLNPRTKTASAVIGTNNFDSALTGAKVITYDGDNPDTNIDGALEVIQGFEYEANGIVIAPAMRSAIAAMKVNGARKYPEFAWGATPGSLGSMTLDSNTTLSFNSGVDRAIVGDFQTAFKWGVAKNLPLKVIEYGNPDNDATLGDLQGHNQVYLRSEMYLGWGILDPNAFARVAVVTQGAGEGNG